MSPLCKVGTDGSVHDIAAALSGANFADIARKMNAIAPSVTIAFEEDGLRNKWMRLEYNISGNKKILLRIGAISGEFWIYSITSDRHTLIARARTAEDVLDVLQSHLNEPGPATV